MDSEKENLILSYVTYTFLLALMLVVSYAIYSKITFPSQVRVIEPYYVSEVKILTSDEVQNERTKLAPFAVKTDTIHKVTAIQSISQNYSDSSIEQTGISTDPAPAKDYSVDPGTVEDLLNPSAKVENTISDTAYPTDLPLSFKGSVVKIDLVNKWITLSLSDGSGMANVRVDSQTKIMINGEEIRFNDIKIADIVSAEGFGTKYADMHDTKILIISGFHQINI